MEKLNLQIKTYAKKINAPLEYLPTIEACQNDGHPMIQEVHGFYHLVIKERDIEYNRKIFQDVNDILYEIFDSVTFSMATDFELKNRIK
jgi:hypothetical protein